MAEILISTTRKNYYPEKFDQAGEVVKSYRGTGLKKADVDGIISELSDEVALNDDWKEELLMDISCRISGFCVPSSRIEWY